MGMSSLKASLFFYVCYLHLKLNLDTSRGLSTSYRATILAEKVLETPQKRTRLHERKVLLEKSYYKHYFFFMSEN